MPRYKITENPPPFTQGETTVTEIDTDADVGLISQLVSTNRLIDTPLYKVIQSVSAPARPPKTIVINNEIIIQEGSQEKSQAEGVKYSIYTHSETINNITSKIILPFNNIGSENLTKDIQPPVWNINDGVLSFTEVGKIYKVIILLRATTNVLDAVIEVGLESVNNINDFIIHREQRFLLRQVNDLVIELRITTNPTLLNTPFNLYFDTLGDDSITLSDMFLQIVKLN